MVTLPANDAEAWQSPTKHRYLTKPLQLCDRGTFYVQDARGVSDFEALQVALRSQPSRLIFYAFDLLHLDGKHLLDRPLVERRAKLLLLVSHWRCCRLLSRMCRS